MKECYPLPGRRIDLEGTSYFVHGLVHDNPLISISPEFKKFVSDKLEGYDLICEDGFASWFDKAVSFDESKYFKFDKVNFFKIIQILFSVACAKLNNKNKSQLLQQVQEMRTFENFETIRKTLFNAYLPEPAGMNSLLSKLNRGTIKNPGGELPLRIRRYVYEARESLKYSKENNLNELHILVGCAHELPLEYLLQNKRVLDSLVV